MKNIKIENETKVISYRITQIFLGIILFFILIFIPNRSAYAASASEINSKVDVALQTLYKNSPGASNLAKEAKAILVFPDIVKAGLIVGGQFGNGALRKNGKTVAYYRSVAASYGLQAGVQSFGYVLFFMDESSLQYLEKSKGCTWVWEVCIYMIKATCTRNEKQGEFLNEYKGNFYTAPY